MTGIGEFLGILIIGALLSFIIESVTETFGTNSAGSKAITIVLAIVVGTFYVLARSTPWFETVVSILTAASTVYAFVIKKDK